MDVNPPRAQARLRAAAIRLTIVLSLGAAGCSTTPASMKVAPELAGVVSEPVVGRNGNAVAGALAFDRWSATETLHEHDEESVAHGKALGTSAAEELGVGIQRTGFEFDLRSNGLPSTTRGQCVARGRLASHTTHRRRTSDETSVTVPGYPRLDCVFSGAQTGRLTVRPTFVTQRDTGSGQFGEHLWEIRSVNNLASQRTNFPLARFGYEFRMGDRVVAAVETLGAGRVWTSPTLRPQDEEELAVAMTALLYYGSLLELDET